MAIQNRLLKYMYVYMLLLWFSSFSLCDNTEGVNDEETHSNQTSTPNSVITECKESNDQNKTLETCKNGHSMSQKIMENKDMLKRTFIVLLLVTAVVVIYFVIRAARLRRSRKTRKYGLLARPDKLEMQPLDMDDDEEDEDVTVYEMNGRRK